MDKGTPQTHPPDDWKPPAPTTDADRMASYRRDRERDRRCIADLEAQLKRMTEDRDDARAQLASLREAIRKHKATYSYWNSDEICEDEKELWAALDALEGE